METYTPWAAAIAALSLFSLGTAAAECFTPPPFVEIQGSAPADAVIDPVGGDAERDRRGRIVAPVYVNGEGPFRFIIDTGANRSVLSPGLAERLGLTPFGAGAVHTIHSQTTAPLVSVRSLRYGNLPLPSEELPLLGGAVLAGEHGLLGVDGLVNKRLRVDFDRNCIEIIPSSGAPRLRGWAALDGEIRFGHLMLVRGRAAGIDINVLIDTGSDSTLANHALAEALRTRMSRPVRGSDDFARAYTAGEPIILDRMMMVRSLSLDRLQVQNLVAYVGDFHVFQVWNLQDEPTLLLGMDVIARARSMAIDYGRSTVHFRLYDEDRRVLGVPEPTGAASYQAQ